MCVCVCVFFVSVVRAIRLVTNEQTSALAGGNQSLLEGATIPEICVCVIRKHACLHACMQWCVVVAAAAADDDDDGAVMMMSWVFVCGDVGGSRCRRRRRRRRRYRRCVVAVSIFQCRETSSAQRTFC